MGVESTPTFRSGELREHYSRMRSGAGLLSGLVFLVPCVAFVLYRVIPASGLSGGDVHSLRVLFGAVFGVGVRV